jgi:O-antigen ligase
MKQKAQTGARWAAVALGVSIPVSTAMDSILIGLILALWVVSGYYATLFDIIRRNVIVVPVLLVVGLYVTGVLYGPADLRETLSTLSKGVVLLLIPILIPIFRDPSARDHAIAGFLLASIVILVLSFGIWSGLIPAMKLLKGIPEDPVVFRLHITHSLLMAFASFLFAVQARECTRRPLRAGWILLSFLAAVNVLFLVPGRTGQLVIVLLSCYAFYMWWRWRGAALAAALLISVIAMGSLMPSSVLHQGMNKIVNESQEWTAGSARHGESVKLRLDFYVNSLEIIKESPLYGVGTGGFARAYAEKVTAPDAVQTDNPHNEYLMVAAQFGVVGLGVWLFLFFRQWTAAERLSSLREKMMAQGLVITILSASMVTSTLTDHTERIFFVWMSALVFAALPPKPAEKGS